MRNYTYKSKSDFLRANGFNEDEVTFAIVGGNTYSIKDSLKIEGCKFNKELGWHSPTEFKIEADEEFFFIPFTFDELYNWNDNSKIATMNESAENLLNERFAPYKKSNTNNLLESSMMDSEFLGEIGDRLRKIPALIVGKKRIENSYGTSTLFTFESGNSVLCWFTSTVKPNEVGEKILLSGTVKDQKTFKNQKQTYLTRCIIYPMD